MNPYMYYPAPQYPVAGYRPVMQQPMPQAVTIKGRPVASVDEVRAAQIELDGSTTYFPCPAEKVIYSKAIDLNGMPVIQAYKLSNNETPCYITREQFEGLERRLNSLETTVIGGVSNVESNATNAVNV